MSGAELVNPWSRLAGRTEIRELLVHLGHEERTAQRTVHPEGRNDWTRRARLTRWLIVERLRGLSNMEDDVPSELGKWLTMLGEEERTEQSLTAQDLRELIVERLRRRTSS